MIKNFKICAFADEASDQLDEQIKALLDNQMDGLEIRGVDGQNIADVTPDKAKEIAKKLQDNGLCTWSIGSPIGKIGIEEDFAPHFDKFKRLMETADILGAKTFRLFSFFIEKDKNPADFTDAVLERLSRFCDYAKGSGIVLCHENEKGIYGDIASRCLTIHQALPELKAVFDPANFIQCGQETLSAYEQLKPYVYYMHIKDALENGDVVPAGKGIGHVGEIIRMYGENGGSVLTLEPHLKVFDGLQALEREGEKSNVGTYAFESQRAAFDAGAAALRALL